MLDSPSVHIMETNRQHQTTLCQPAHVLCETNQLEGIVRAIYMMRECLSEPLTIDTLAEEAFFSKFHFTRIFQTYTGMSPGRFLAELRLMSAEHILLTSDLSFTDITFRVGYSSIGTFSSRFKTVVGISPSSYRSQGTSLESPLVVPYPPRNRSRVVRQWLDRVEATFGIQDHPTNEWSGAVPH